MALDTGYLMVSKCVAFFLMQMGGDELSASTQVLKERRYYKNFYKIVVMSRRAPLPSSSSFCVFLICARTSSNRKEAKLMMNTFSYTKRCKLLQV